ncbi:MAG: acyl-CoA/acyl-ACP dehydrogenase [Sphingomonadaceae bacterium]|nr:acyl-CoA/acyl-ACP dehydrogenase [Sphingomonadaceae bacterium]
MTMTREELTVAAEQAFSAQDLAPDAETSWQTISDMGWLMMCVPDERGGLGLGLEARAVIHHALGRSLVSGPAITQMMAIDGLAGGERSAATDALLERAMTGEVMTAPLSHTRDGKRLEAVPDADRASHVLDTSDERIALIPLAGCTIVERETWDTTRRLFDVTPTGEGAVTLAQGETAKQLNAAIQTNMLVALAADALGGAEAALAMSVEYLGTRRQFGRPLAMFQALKHRCANMRAQLSLAEALLWQEVQGSPDPIAAGALKAHCCHAYQHIAEEAIQLHGGVGLTVEHSCHLFLKRAFLDGALGGTCDHWEELAGRRLLAAE